MKKIYLACFSIAVLMFSCQKETTLASKQNADITNLTSNSTAKGVSVKKNGYPYREIETSNSLEGGSEIGWSLNLNTLAQYNLNNSSHHAATSNLGESYLYCGGIKTVNLYAGQNILMGTITYANDATNLYITYTTNPDWYMADIHLYVGTLSGTPISGGGTPSPGKFPIKNTFTASTLSQSITYEIPLTSFVNSGFIIAAHTSVIRVDTDGDVIAKETAWAAGTRFQSNKNWATYITGSLGTCDNNPIGDLSNHQNNKN